MDKVFQIGTFCFRLTCIQEIPILLWSSIFVTLVAKKSIYAIRA